MYKIMVKLKSEINAHKNRYEKKILPSDEIDCNMIDIFEVRGIDAGSSFALIEFAVGFGAGVSSGMVANYLYDLAKEFWGTTPGNDKFLIIENTKIELEPEKIKIEIEKLTTSAK